jgi:DNA-binding XRE family transcriptional regulator
MNKSQLARYLGKSRAYITRLERGEIQPRLVVALKMARHFGKQVGEIFQLNDLENKP